MLLAGPPASGKTTLARALARASPARMLHVENDRLRPLVARRLGGESEPRFTERETQATYRLARALIARGLGEDMAVVHDATNLEPDRRAAAVREARSSGAPVLVVAVHAPREVRDRRAERGGPGAKRAHEALGGSGVQALKVQAPTLRVDGTGDPDAAAQRVRQRLEALVAEQGDASDA